MIYLIVALWLGHSSIPTRAPRAYISESDFCTDLAALNGMDDSPSYTGYRVDLAKGAIEEVECVVRPVEIKVKGEKR